ncbi:MAG: tRNA pseudouridine(38-40) synthase TruA [Chloroflexi bacterium]|jgi:tRNA pseudouridine38-40 synthase|nr:tRNA pseudouridine(38-40) synthase TruA [Chloroflexota bacterium]MBT7080854.1 tRNA pseudouridine(38-40) synthase TruA [Chloroflexota bacterium]MBT7289394.1 tRNA pseudouridine(38-40) synthase TruA [Chloroflexota bacterium]
MDRQSAPVKMLVCVVEYDGTNYHGFQLQTSEPTIQGELEKALKKLTGESIRVIGASRTDAGVHAKAQVIGFKSKAALEIKNYADGLNHYLPRDIAVRSAQTVDSNFKLRGEVKNREYRYRILNSKQRSPLEQNRAYHIDIELDLDTMVSAAGKLVGTHDFASFTTSDNYSEDTTRIVYDAGFSRKDDLILFDIKANSFLKQQVRRTIGTLIRVGTGDITTEEFERIINARKYGLAKPTAPPDGLYLTAVNYNIDL